MLNAYLMKGGEQKKTKFYEFTEPFFVSLNTGYANALTKFLKEKMVEFSNHHYLFGINCIILRYSSERNRSL